eukprot:6127773-Karenia_brevis.AAC.1
MCSKCIWQGIDTANNIEKHIRDYHDGDASLLEVSSYYDDKGNIAPDFQPMTKSFWNMPQTWKDMEPQWDKFIQNMIDGASDTFPFK